jgi:predicted phosphoribosyltransferase
VIDLPFADLRTAGCLLARKLEQFKEREDFVVLGLARGGVPVAYEVAAQLRLPLDVIWLRRLFDVGQDQLPIATVNLAGTSVSDARQLEYELRSEPGIKFFLDDALEGLTRNVTQSRGDRPLVCLKRKSILLVDNGIRTGKTLRAVIIALRSQDPKSIIVAAPVSNPEAISGLKPLVEELVILRSLSHLGTSGCGTKNLMFRTLNKFASF